MKKIITVALLLTTAFLLPLLAENNQPKAQIVTTLLPTVGKQTLTNTDTAYVYISTAGGAVSTGVPDNISRSITAVVTKTSGTVAGTVYLEATNGTWAEADRIDSLTLADVAINKKTFSLRHASGSMLYKQYRCVFFSTGTNVQVPKVLYHRRSN